MKEEKKEENKIVEEAIVVNEKDIVNPDEVKTEETIEVEAPKVIIEKEEETEPTEEVITNTGETKKDLKGESKAAPEPANKKELVAILNVYYDKVLKIDITKGKLIKDVYVEKGEKLTKKREEELVKAGVAEYKEI